MKAVKIAVFVGVLCGAWVSAHGAPTRIYLEHRHSAIEQWFMEGVQLHPAAAETFGGDRVVATRNWSTAGSEADLELYWNTRQALPLSNPSSVLPCTYLAGATQALVCVRPEGVSSDVNAKFIFFEPSTMYSNLNPRNTFAKRRYAGVWSERGSDAKTVHSVYAGGAWRLYYHQRPFGPGDLYEVEDKGRDYIEPAVNGDVMAWVEYVPFNRYDEQYVVTVGERASGFRAPMSLGNGRFPSLAKDDYNNLWYAYEQYYKGTKRIVFGVVDLPGRKFSEEVLETPCSEPSRPIISKVAGEMTIAYLCGPEICSGRPANATLYLSHIKGCFTKIADLDFRPGEEEPSPFSFYKHHLTYTALVNPGTNDYDVFYDWAPQKFIEVAAGNKCF